MKVFIKQFSPTSHYLIPFRSKYFSQLINFNIKLYNYKNYFIYKCNYLPLIVFATISVGFLNLIKIVLVV
jgi:hypothetical protein